MNPDDQQAATEVSQRGEASLVEDPKQGANPTMPAVPPHWREWYSSNVFVDGDLVYHTVHDCPEGISIEERFLREGIWLIGELSASTASVSSATGRW